jgi:hypothetical protein
VDCAGFLEERQRYVTSRGQIDIRTNQALTPGRSARKLRMSTDPKPAPESDPPDLATDQVIAACVRAAVRAFAVAEGLLEAELNVVYAASPKACTRGRIKGGDVPTFKTAIGSITGCLVLPSL